MFHNYYQFIHNLQQAIQDELEAAAFYGSLLELAPPADQEDISHIRTDELRHGRLLSQLYTNLTGRPPVTMPVDTPAIPSYLAGLETAIRDELKAVEVYRDLLLSTTNPRIRDTLFAIMVDEQEHATRLTFLYGKNK